ncbi:cilia- and flagella-associated protein 46-like isoform X2 [Ruditapes philippinarum]|uniref:cilia- and flagella-associated protein 46-like isoform X2 n=1 Tax=Ruditapes philippinarum TaxID=129788 RepID=UPI00295B50CA|nr:cilia- and flagella-associated protein 46-like isoform X2 [Ruditapes philippinarum]
MDSSIRSLLVAAQKISGQEKNPSLLQAYSLLRNVAENKPSVDNPEAFSPDLYVQCAEIAFQNGLFDISKECLKMYFMKPPPGNQFLCRAYLCQSQLLAPTATIPEQLEKAVVYLLKAISFAKENPRYHFLVYNASVIYWQFCRPFLKQNFRQFLARSLHSVVKALDDIDDKDFEWRAQLMIALIECNLDAGKKNDAAQIASAAATFIKQNVPHLYKQVFGLIIRNQLIDSSKFHKDIKASPELGIFYMICKLKVSLENNEPKEYYAEIQRILNQMGVPHSESHSKKKKARQQSPSSVTDLDSDLMSREVSELSLPESLKGKSPTSKLKAGDLRKALLSEKTNESLKSRSRSPAVRASREGSIVKQKTHRDSDRKSPTKGTGRRTPTPTSTKKISDESQEKPYLLLELARLCLELDFPDLAQDCADHMKTCSVKDPGFYLELEFLQCDIMVKHLAEKQESLHKHVVDIRQQAIKRCEEVIMNAIRLGNPNVIQVGCVTQWNLCLPLLQPNLRHHVRKPLTLVAEALENIQSLLVQLRCQVHTELAKCEEDVEQIEVAMTNLKKALALDDAKIYQERLEVMLHRLELRSELYQQPERVEDIAGMIIEQARKANSGTMRMKRSLLVKAGEALAPDAFNLVLDSESSTKALELAMSKNSHDVTGGKAPLTQIKKLSNKARQFNKCVKKAEGHLQRLGNENDRERARLWGDLAKTARKQEVWDVCRVASRFCLLYDDGRWKNIVIEKDESPKPVEKIKTVDSSMDGTLSSNDRSSTQLTQQDGGRSDSPTPQSSLSDKDLLRMFAEVNFIQGEAMVHLLRTEGVQLNDAPIPPVDTRKHPKGYVAKKPEEDPDWIEYCDWIKSLSENGTSSFLRGLALGVELNEAWLVCCASTYVWNYNNHVLTQLRHREIMDTLTVVFDGLKKVGHANETSSLVNICNALSYALMKPWIPVPSKEEPPAPETPRIDSGKKGKADPKAKKTTANTVSIPSEAMPDLKKAIEVCEYVIEVTNGTNPQDVVAIPVRMPILQTWVFAKQMAQQQITKNLGLDEEPWTEGQKAMSRSIVAVEMLKLNKNNIMEFKEVPPITEVANMVEECRWTDKFVELQLWSHLTSLAYDQKMHSLVIRCSKKALRFVATGTQPKNKKIDGHNQMVEFEMLSYSSGILGQSLVDNMGGKNAIRREALSAFLDSARFAMKADNYELVMTAARHYWNACCPLVSQPIERELLREPIRIILQCITETADSLKKREEKSDDEKKEEDGGESIGDMKEEEKTVGGIGAVEDDLTLRAALYGVFFQSFADKGEWEAGLQAMDQAIADMPRTKHRLLIFKHRVITKAKLGRSVAMDIQKFKTEMKYLNRGRASNRKDESEDYVAHMWRRVALMSKETAEQLLSYQNAIEALNSQSNEWLKIELLLEFAQWLCVKDFPLEDCTDQVEWAIDIMQNMQAEIDTRKEEEAKAAAEAAEVKKAAKGGKKDKKGAAPPKPKVPSAKKERTQVKEADKEKDKGDSKDVNPEDMIPQTREAVIGVLPTNPTLKVQDITDIKVLDGLIRAHVLLAEIVGRGVPQYADYLLMAHAYLMKLWQVTVKVSGPTMKEILKNPPQAGENNNAKGSAKKKDKGAEKAPVKEKPKRKGPLDIIPNTLEEWAVYDVPDEVIEAFKHELMEETGINKHTIVKPMLTLHYLESMVTQLRDIGYNHLTLPVLAFEDLLSRDLLHNDSLKFLVHSRAVEVCLELNLTNGYTFHEKICGPVNMNEADQAKSRDDIAFWKEKQAQVIKEEMRVRETIAKLAEETKQSTRSLLTKRQETATTEQSTDKVVSHLGKVLGAVQFRDVWTDTAEVLIRQGHYQSAREFLMEAHSAGVSFSDIPLQARALYLLGTLAYEEAQFGQAINYCQKAQALYYGDEMFWYETTMLMANSTIQDYENRNAKRIARGILVHSLNEFMRIQDERPNRASSLSFIISMIEARLAGTQWSIIQEEYPDINDPLVMKRVHEICEKFDEAISCLVRMGYKREALPLMKEHADILRKMAQDSLEAEIRHTYYLQGMIVLKDAVSTSEEILTNIQSLYSLQEIRGMSLPVQREAADIKIACGELLLEIFRVHAAETRNQQLEDQRKGSVLKMVEDFIRATPVYTHMEKDWVETTRVVIEEAVSKFLDAHNQAMSIPRLKAKSLCGVGQCLRALSLYQSSDAPTHWVVTEMELAKLSDIPEENESGGTEELDKHSRQFLKYAKQIRQMKGCDSVSRQYLIQATECLVQTLLLALNKKYTDIAAVAALELVECFGQYDPIISTQFLALYQSCNVSVRLNDLLHRAQLDPIQSKLAALLRQRENLLTKDVSYNTGASSVMSTVCNALENDWQAWKKMDILTNHMDILKEFPANFNFIILQHSPDKKFLYGAVLEKPKGVPGAGGADKKGNPKQGAPAPNRAKIFGMETSRAELEGLLNKCREHRQNVQQLLVKQEYQRSQAAMRRKMLENLDDSMKSQKPKEYWENMNDVSTLVDESEKEERHLQDEFRDLVMAIEMYLKPITAQFEGLLVPAVSSPSTSITEKPGREPKEPPAPPQEYAILLADPELMELPLEALKVFQAESIVSLTRDFSLQLFYHRYHQDNPEGEGQAVPSKKGEAPKSAAPKSGKSAHGQGSDDAAAAAKKAKAKGADQPFSRIPGMRDASKKMAKIIPLSRQLNQWNIPVDTMNFRFIVDPHLDCAETEENKPIDVFNKILEEYEQQFTPRWLGVMGNEHTPSVGEWEVYLLENSSFIFYGMERLLSYIPPAKLSALNIPECMIMYSLDMAQTTKSFTRQSKVDVLKSSKVLPLEKPVETAMLTSLTGIKCILGNQWHCTLAENAAKLNITMKDLLESGLSTGEAVRMLFTPYRRKIPLTESGEAEGEEADKKEDESKGDGSVTDRSQTSDKTSTTVQEYKENIDIQRSWFNFICYGLPNIVVTQM